MTTNKSNGYRVYQLLIPVAVTIDGQEVRFDHIEMRGVTFGLERRWEDGLIDGERGMLDALMRELVVQPFEAVEALVHPDSNRFIQEFMMHLPAGMGSSITSGNLPAPAAPPRSPYGGPSYSADDPSPWGPDAASAPAQPPRSALPGEETIHDPDAGYAPDPAGSYEQSEAPGEAARQHPLGVDLDG